MLKFKKITAILLAVALLLGAMPFALLASAEGTVPTVKKFSNGLFPVTNNGYWVFEKGADNKLGIRNDGTGYYLAVSGTSLVLAEKNEADANQRWQLNLTYNCITNVGTGKHMFISTNFGVAGSGSTIGLWPEGTTPEWGNGNGKLSTNVLTKYSEIKTDVKYMFGNTAYSGNFLGAEVEYEAKFDAIDTNVHTDTADKGGYWKLESADSYYLIKNDATGYYLGTNGAIAALKDKVDKTCYWQLEDKGDGTGKIRVYNIASKLSLTLDGNANLKSGTAADPHTPYFADEAGNTVSIANLETGKNYKIYNGLYTAHCLAVPADKIPEPELVVTGNAKLYGNTATVMENSGYWLFEKGNGFWRIKEAESGFYLTDVNGSLVLTKLNLSAKSQRWVLGNHVLFGVQVFDFKNVYTGKRIELFSGAYLKDTSTDNHIGLWAEGTAPAHGSQGGASSNAIFSANSIVEGTKYIIGNGQWGGRFLGADINYEPVAYAEFTRTPGDAATLQNYWRVEAKGDAYYVRNATTGYYLADYDGKVALKDKKDAYCLWKFPKRISTFLLQNVKTGLYLLVANKIAMATFDSVQWQPCVFEDADGVRYNSPAELSADKSYRICNQTTAGHYLGVPASIVPETPVLPDVIPDPEVAKIGDVIYKTLAEAVAAAADGDVITVLEESEGEGIVINKDITIDFGGYTYAFTSGVGSTGTESNGFQILKENNVVLKNGTLKVADSAKDKFYILVQNYANLTVTDMILDGTNLDKYSLTDGDSYTLSNNSGNVVVNGATTIIANDEGDLAFAFDACKNAYYTAPVVTIADTVVIDGAVEAAAKVGGVYYATFDEAFNAAADGDVITVMKAYEGKGYVIDKDITIDFGGNTFAFTSGVGSTGTESNGFQILKENNVVLKNGTLKVADSAKGKFYILVQNYANLTVTDMILDGTNLDKYSLTDGDSYTLSNNSGNVVVNGETTIIANDEGDLAFAFDACKNAYYTAPVVTIADTVVIDGAVEAAAKVGGVYYATFDEAFNAAADGDVITVMKAYEGKGYVIDKDITIDFGGNTFAFTSGVGSTGTESNGFQILKENNVVLKNGTLKVADSAKGKFYILVQNYANLTVTDMVLDGTNLDKYSLTDGDSYTLSNNSGNVVVNGATTIIANDEGDLAFAFDACKNAYYTAPVVTIADTVVVEGNVEAGAKLGNVYYATLKAAYDAAADGDVITVMKNAEGEGIVINKDITIDFGGYTYAFTSGVGSTGTESNGFQILKENNVVLKNGTLKVADSAKDKFYILVQNYANLTVTDMILDGTNLDKYSLTDGDSYTLSNNSGNVVVNGETTIIANDEGDLAFAFDACKNAYYTAPVVTIADTVVVKGNVEAALNLGTVYYATEEDAFDLNDDGEIDIRDLVRLKKVAANMTEQDVDLDGDGYIVNDLVYLRKYLTV